MFPLILRILPAETIGIWSVFLAISSFVALLDFGFSSSFSRNITYIFSGVNKLEKKGITQEELHSDINYELLGKTIKSMKWFYGRIALAAFFVLSIVGTWYILHLLKQYSGGKTEIIIAWVIFCAVNTYNLSTLYYESLLVGRGLVKKSKQIILLSQIVALILSVVLIFSGFGLIAIVAAQLFSLLIKRILSNKAFFTEELKSKLSGINTENYKEVLKVITPNSVKLGITGLGGFLALHSSVIIGSLYVPLPELASYGITMQVVNVIAALGTVYYFSFLPKISFLRISNNILVIKRIYIKSVLMLIFTFIICGVITIVFGNQILLLLKSKTLLLGSLMTAVTLLIALLGKNHAIAGGFLLTKNEVPFFNASLISGIFTVILLFIFLKLFNFGIWGMILASGIVQLAYNNWKWPLALVKELNLKKE